MRKEHTIAPVKPPKHLAKTTGEWWSSVLHNFELEPHHVKLLTLSCQAWDRAEQARKVLDKEGLTYLDRFQAPRSRPEVAIERDSRIAFAKLLRELSLDVDPPPESPRIPRQQGRYRGT